MESLRLLILIVLLCIFDFDSTTGKLHIYGSYYNSLYKSSKCNACLILPRYALEIFDPGNTRIEVSTKDLSALAEKCPKTVGISGLIDRFMGPLLNRASKWCGNNNDTAVINCCNERSKCPVKMERSWAKKNLNEDIVATIYGRDCEKNFVECLRKVGNKEAKKVFKYKFKVFPGSYLTYDHPFHCTYKTVNIENSKRMDCTKDEQKPKKWQVREFETGRPYDINFPTGPVPWEIPNY